MKVQWTAKLRKVLRETTAQDMVEYALLLGFVAVSLTAAFPAAQKPWRRLTRKIFNTVALAAGVGNSWNC